MLPCFLTYKRGTSSSIVSKVRVVLAAAAPARQRWCRRGCRTGAWLLRGRQQWEQRRQLWFAGSHLVSNDSYSLAIKVYAQLYSFLMRESNLLNEILLGRKWRYFESKTCCDKAPLLCHTSVPMCLGEITFYPWILRVKYYPAGAPDRVGSSVMWSVTLNNWSCWHGRPEREGKTGNSLQEKTLAHTHTAATSKNSCIVGAIPRRLPLLILLQNFSALLSRLAHQQLP